jgi:hypothetical protein
MACGLRVHPDRSVTLLLLTCLLAWLAAAPAPRAAAQAGGGAGAPVKQKQWEYCELFSSRQVSDNSYVVVFEGPNGAFLREASYVDMCAKLGGKATNNNSTEVLNHLGKDGWELITHSQTVVHNNGSAQEVRITWMLKRPRKD